MVVSAAIRLQCLCFTTEQTPVCHEQRLAGSLDIVYDVVKEKTYLWQSVYVPETLLNITYLGHIFDGMFSVSDEFIYLML